MISRGAREFGNADFRLREVAPADSEMLYRWRMDPGSRFAFRSAEEVPFETHAAFVARYFSPESTDRWFVIEAAGEPVGSIALYAFSADGREAEWGRLVIAPERRRRGHAGRALALLIDHARDLGVATLRCEVLEGNAAAQAAYARAGFHEESRETVSGRVFRRLVRDLSAPRV
ncbi:MAG TPA: GNAT family N-acetyltransferase [Thermoanaerobaculia bacterium]